MTLYTPEYIALQAQLHEQPAYGSRGYYWAYLIAGIAYCEGCKSVLDYGCGKGTIGKTLARTKLLYQGYDPAIEQFAGRPSPADLVVCCDVMEHIEHDCLASVVYHIRKLTKKLLFVAISTRPSKRWMADGRNTHLIVEADDWWRDLFQVNLFEVRREWKTGLQEWVALMRAT